MQSNLIYNEEQKQEYINYENKNSESLTNYFKRISKKEYEYGKDIIEMDIDELKDTISSLNICREESRGHVISLMRAYANWAKLYGKTNNNILNYISPESINSTQIIKRQMLKSPEQLYEILNTTLDNKNYANRAKRDALIFWLLYYGMILKEIQLLKKNSLDYENKTITTEEDKKYNIDDGIIELWKYCSTMTYIEKKNGKSGEYVHYNLIDNEYLFRPVDNNISNRDTISMNVFNVIVLKVFKDYSEKKDSENKLNVNPMNIRLSGIFYRMYLLEKEAITPEVIAEHLNIEYSNRDDLMTKTRKWRIDYDNWKLAFGYM